MEYYTRNIKEDALEMKCMNATERGIFITLIDYYMIYEKALPLCEKKLLSITGTRSKSTLLKILSNNFIKMEDGYIHKRHSKILDRVKKAVSKKENTKSRKREKEKTQPVDNLLTTCAKHIDSNEMGDKFTANLQQIYNKFTANLQQICSKFAETAGDEPFKNNILDAEETPPLKHKHKHKHKHEYKKNNNNAGFNFEKFIDMYPKKVDQWKMGKAANIWKFEKLDMCAGKILGSVQERVKNSDWVDLKENNSEKFIPDPATFLAEKMYEQEFKKRKPKISDEERIKIESLKIEEDYKNGKL